MKSVKLEKLHGLITSFVVPDSQYQQQAKSTFISSFNPILEDKIQYLYTYFKLAYFFCAVPFRFQLASDTPGSALLIKKNLFQQILCGINYSWGLYKYIPSLYATKYNHSRIASFDFVALLASFGCRTSFIYFMTRKQKGFLKIINFVREDQNRSKKIYNRGKLTWIVGISTCVYCTIGAFYTLTGISRAPSLNDWSPREIWATYCGQMKFNLFLLEKSDPVSFQDISVIEHIGTVIYIILKCYNQICSHFIGNGFLVISLLMHHISRDFQQLMNSKQEKIDEVIERFWQLKHFTTEKINPIYGSLVLFWVLEALPYYSGNLDAIFFEKIVAKKIRNIVYICNFSLTFLIAADAHYKISQLKDWLMERRSKLRISEMEFVMIMHALSPSEVGLKSYGFFTVTYEFLSTLGNVILTYAIILINFANTDQVSFYGYNNIL